MFLAIDIGNFNYRYVECSSTEIINRYNLVPTRFIHAICQCSSCRLVDNSLYIQSGNLTCIFCGLALRVIEICWDRNNCFINCLANVVLSCLFHFFEYFCRNLRCGFTFTLNLNPCITVISFNNFIWHHVHIFLNYIIVKSSAYQTLHGIYSIFWICDSLSFGRLPCQYLSILRVGNDRGCSSRSLCILYHLRRVSF